MNATIRAARDTDIGLLVPLGEKFFDDSSLKEVTDFDPMSFMATLAYLIDPAQPSSLLVVEKDGVLIGMAGCVLYPLYCNISVQMGQEIFLWVEPEYRNGIGFELLDQLEADARAKGAKAFFSANLSGERDRAFGRVYARRGYRPSENVYRKVLS